MLIASGILLIILAVCLAIYVYKSYKYSKLIDKYCKELDKKYRKYYKELVESRRSDGKS